ncbi:MAG: hypothetical protein WCX73_03090 [Candidatus Pacearchaeota archaeon]|jgi:hypothetical protein
MLEKQLEFDFMKEEHSAKFKKDLKEYSGIAIKSVGIAMSIPVCSTIAVLGYEMIKDHKTTIDAIRVLYQAITN